jgi:uncharacterized protein (DUF934 family)
LTGSSHSDAKLLQSRIGWADTVHAHLTNVVDAINRRCPA